MGGQKHFLLGPAFDRSNSINPKSSVNVRMEWIKDNWECQHALLNASPCHIHLPSEIIADKYKSVFSLMNPPSETAFHITSIRAWRHIFFSKQLAFSCHIPYPQFFTHSGLFSGFSWYCCIFHVCWCGYNFGTAKIIKSLCYFHSPQITNRRAVISHS